MYTIPKATVRRISSQIRRQMRENQTETPPVYTDPAEMALDVPKRMLEVIARSLHMSPACFEMKSRVRTIIELRFLGALMLRQKFPAITLKEIGMLFGGQDHTSVMNGIEKAYTYIHTGDKRFIDKYHTARRSVNSWIARNNIDVLQQVSLTEDMMLMAALN